MNGQSIAQFEIIEQIGQGGMGVVYKARDTRLNRIVALKVLPADRVNDAARRSRFTQEAQAASALNHPNIVTIYDILHQEGMQAIAMEFVKGRTLESLAGRKGLPLADVLKYSLQIADALAAAHAAGIVHRDLKPGNVMVTESGAIKVLDFGLAKLTEPAGDDEATRSMRLDDAPKTEEGTLVGTVAYMSPEQAEGKKVDARSDIFSFGVMLYEMVTGRRAFQGDSRLSILSAILRDEPKPPSQWGEPIPRDLEKIIARCMRKDSARRFQHMDDLKVALQDLKEESESGVLMAEVPAVVSKRRSTWLLPVGIAALMIAAGAAWWLTRPQKPAAVPDVRRVTFDSGMTISPALSRDGKLLAYASDRAGDGKLDIWLQQVSGGDAVRLTKLPDDEDMPAFSPDGSKIAFLYRSRNEPGIYVISTLGGEPRRVTARGARASSSGKFSPDGNWIVYTAIEGVRNAIFVMPSGGGAPRRLAESSYYVAAPIWSADGKHILFFGSHEEKGPFFERFDWWVTPAEGGPPVRTGIMQALVRQGVARYPDARPNFPHAWAGNRILFSVASNDIENLWEIFLNPKTFHADGEARQLTFGTAREHGPSLAANGSLAFTAVSTNTDFWSLPLDANTGKPKGEIRQVTRNSAADSDSIASLTADGKAILFCSSKSGNADIWRRDLETGSETPVIATPAAEHFGRASSDGSRILYGKAEAGETVVYLSSAAATQKICAGCTAIMTGDGARVFYAEGNLAEVRDLFMLDVASGQRTQVLKAGKDVCFPCLYEARFSPDNRWGAFHHATSAGTRGIVLVPFRDGKLVEAESILVTDKAGEGVPNWSPDGNLLYMVSNRDGYFCIWAQPLDPASKKPKGDLIPVQHFHTPNRYARPRGFSVARDKLVVSLAEGSSNIFLTKLPQ